jgi:radical SAM superfamily enzyme YgiQ (UPF0313 family)
MKLLLLTAPELPRRSHSAVLPPLASLLLTAAARGAGHEVLPRDLDARLVQRPEAVRALESLALVADPAAAQRYVDGAGRLPEVDALLDELLAPIDLGWADVVGISARRALGARLLARRVRDHVGAPILLGGDLGDDPQEVLATTPAADAVVSGRGEEALVRCLAALARGAGLDGIPGVGCRGPAGVARTPGAEPALAAQPLPDLDGLEAGLYLFQPALLDQLPNPGRRLVLPYAFTAGCPFRCAYCQVPRTRASALAPERIAAEIRCLVERTGVRDFAFLNNTINVGAGFVRDLAAALQGLRLGLRWSDSAAFVRGSEADLWRLRAAGCIGLTFGLESAAASVLRRMRKGHTAAIAARVLRASHELGIWNRVNALVGFPGESDEEFRATVDFVERHADLIDTLSVSSFYLGGSEMLRRPERFGLRVRGWAAHGASPHRSGSYAFDEIGGPAWEERERVAQERRRVLDEAFRRARGRTREITNLNEIHDVYAYVGDKAEIRRRLRDGRGFRFVLFTGAACNNRCPGCPTHEQASFRRAPARAELEAEIHNARRNGYTRAVIAGGEPTLRRDLPELVERMRRAGFDEIVLVTNGRMLAYPGLARRLRQGGVTELVLKLGPDAATHDQRTGVSGSWEQGRTGRANWEALGGRCRVVDGPFFGPFGAQIEL